MTRRETVLSVTAFLLVWFGAGFYFWYRPLTRQIQAVEQQIAAAESKMQLIAGQTGRAADSLAEPDGEEQVLAGAAQLKEPAEQIPAQPAIPELLESLIVWANEAEVRLIGFRTETETAESIDNIGSGPKVIQVHTQIEGRHVQAVAFLLKLVQSGSLICVDQLELGPNSHTGPGQVSQEPVFLDTEGVFNPVQQAKISFLIYER